MPPPLLLLQAGRARRRPSARIRGTMPPAFLIYRVVVGVALPRPSPLVRSTTPTHPHDSADRKKIYGEKRKLIKVVFSFWACLKNVNLAPGTAILTGKNVSRKKGSVFSFQKIRPIFPTVLTVPLVCTSAGQGRHWLQRQEHVFTYYIKIKLSVD